MLFAAAKAENMSLSGGSGRGGKVCARTWQPRRRGVSAWAAGLTWDSESGVRAELAESKQSWERESETKELQAQRAGGLWRKSGVVWEEGSEIGENAVGKKRFMKIGSELWNILNLSIRHHQIFKVLCLGASSHLMLLSALGLQKACGISDGPHLSFVITDN